MLGRAWAIGSVGEVGEKFGGVLPHIGVPVGRGVIGLNHINHNYQNHKYDTHNGGQSAQKAVNARALLFSEKGFRAAAAEAGIEADYLNYGQNISFDNFAGLNGYRCDHHPLIHRVLKPWLTPGHIGGTILCSCDYAAAKVLQSLTRCGYRVPDDFAVAGFGGFAFSAMTEPEITTVKVDSFELGRLAVELLIKCINGEAPALKRELLPVGILKRNSL